MTDVEAIHKCQNKEEFIALRHATRLLALLTENQIKITNLKSHQHSVGMRCIEAWSSDEKWSPLAPQ